jgi:glutathione peroxidase-family protein
MGGDDFYKLACKDAAGADFNFESLRGKVVVIVNVASKCGFTPQYKGLEEMYEKYKDKDLVILGFPCNQFGNQEPGSSGSVVEFCSLTYNVTFPIMDKVQVNGGNASPVYNFLKNQRKNWFLNRIKWNFEKFVIDRSGNIVGRYASWAAPSYMHHAIEKLL